jgi:hypothetical protein
MPSQQLIDRVQQIMDLSAEKAGPVQKGVVSNPRWKGDAARFIEAWEKAHFAVITTVGANGQPHSAVVENVKLQEDGTLRTKMYTASVRRKDIQTNPRISVVKIEGGNAMTIYGKAREVPGTVQESFGGETVDVEIDITRLFGILPQS